MISLKTKTIEAIKATIGRLFWLCVMAYWFYLHLPGLFYFTNAIDV
jgi:hypothetical protein